MKDLIYDSIYILEHRINLTDNNYKKFIIRCVIECLNKEKILQKDIDLLFNNHCDDINDIYNDIQNMYKLLHGKFNIQDIYDVKHDKEKIYELFIKQIGIIKPYPQIFNDEMSKELKLFIMNATNNYSV